MSSHHHLNHVCYSKQLFIKKQKQKNSRDSRLRAVHLHFPWPPSSSVPTRLDFAERTPGFETRIRLYLFVFPFSFCFPRPPLFLVFAFSFNACPTSCRTSLAACLAQRSGSRRLLTFSEVSSSKRCYETLFSPLFRPDRVFQEPDSSCSRFPGLWFHPFLCSQTPRPGSSWRLWFCPWSCLVARFVPLC